MKLHGLIIKYIYVCAYIWLLWQLFLMSRVYLCCVNNKEKYIYNLDIPWV